jgi:hypothetical protein
MNFGARLSTSTANINSPTRTDAATVNLLLFNRAILASAALSYNEVAFGWTSSANGGFPTGGPESYSCRISFAKSLNANSLWQEDGSGLQPPTGMTSTSFNTGSTLSTQEFVAVNSMTGSCNTQFPGAMYTRETMRVNYGNSYGLAYTTNAGYQLDWGPDTQTFAALYIGNTLTYSGFVPGYYTWSGTANGFVASTSALFLKQTSTFSINRLIDRSIN